MTEPQQPPVASEPAKPEETIRGYLDEHGGETDATVGHLLTTFAIDHGDVSGRDQIKTALSAVGVGIDRPLSFLRTDDGIHLSVVDTDGTTAPAAANGANGHDEETLDLGADVARLAPPERRAGLYHDPTDHDGSGWTDETRPPQPTSFSRPLPHTQVQGPDATREFAGGGQPPRQVGQGSPTPWYERWWVPLAGILVIAAGIPAALVLTSDDSTTSTPTAATAAKVTIATKPFTVFRKSIATIRGTVSPADATVVVGGVTSTASDGFWSARVPLDLGKNPVDIRVTKQGFKSAAASTVLIRRRAKTTRKPPQGTTPPPSGQTTPPLSTGSSSCGNGLSVGPNTSCPFAELVRASYPGSSASFEVYSPVTDRSYTMSCTTGSPHVCRGGNNASVFFP